MDCLNHQSNRGRTRGKCHRRKNAENTTDAVAVTKTIHYHYTRYMISETVNIKAQSEQYKNYKLTVSGSELKKEKSANENGKLNRNDSERKDNQKCAISNTP